MSATGHSAGSVALAPSPALFATLSEGGSPLHHSLRRSVSQPFPTLAPSLADVPLFPTDRPLITHETTFTYFTTRFVHNTSTVTTRKETITNYEIDSLVRPTQPLILTRTVVLPASRNPTPVIITRHSTLGEGRELIEIDRHEERAYGLLDMPLAAHFDPHSPHVHATAIHPITPTPVTYYTTFTYFTTELEQGHPVVRSREQVISTVVRGKVLPTRSGHRSKRDVLVAGDVTKNSDLILLQSSSDHPAIQTASILDPIPAAVHGKHFFEPENTQVIEYHLHARCNDS